METCACSGHQSALIIVIDVEMHVYALERIRD